MKNRKPFVWPSLRNKPKAVKPEPQNVTEALKFSTMVEKPLRGVPVDYVFFDDVQDFVAQEPLKGSLTPESLEEVSVFAPGAVVGENLEVLAVIEPPSEVVTEPTPEPVVAPVESLPDVPSDLGAEKVVKWSQAMSKAELLKIAQDLGLALDDTPTKAEIVEALKAHDSNG
jgi:hypothetical protein